MFQCFNHKVRVISQATCDNHTLQITCPCFLESQLLPTRFPRCWHGIPCSTHLHCGWQVKHQKNFLFRCLHCHWMVIVSLFYSERRTLESNNYGNYFGSFSIKRSAVKEYTPTGQSYNLAKWLAVMNCAITPYSPCVTWIIVKIIQKTCTFQVVPDSAVLFTSQITPSQTCENIATKHAGIGGTIWDWGTAVSPYGSAVALTPS